MSDIESLRATVEALLFISGDGLTVQDIARGLERPENEIKMILDSLVDDYLERQGGIMIQEAGNTYKFVTQPKIYPNIQKFLKEKKKESLSRAMLETLAIITYKQPITLFEIDEIRGVGSRTLVNALLSKKLVKSLGQKESPGRPTLFGTTREFLEYFGLNSLEELPSPQDVKEFNFDEL